MRIMKTMMIHCLLYGCALLAIAKLGALLYNIAMSLVKITSNAPELVKILKGIPKAMQQVTAATLNDTARAVQVRSERNLKKDMIVRTPYTLKSLKTYKASPGRPIERQDAVTGTISDYLPVHDEGGVVKAKKRRIAVPTNRVRGKDRKKKVAPRYRIDNMKGAFVLGAGPKLKRAALFVRQGKRIVKVRDLGENSYKLKAKKWHSEAVAKYGNYTYMAAVFRRQAEQRIKTR